MTAPRQPEARQAPNEHERALEALLRISQAVGSVMELPDILRRIVAETAKLMGADVSSIYLFEDGGQRLRLRASHGLDPHVVDTTVIDKGQGIPGWTAERGEIAAVADSHDDPRHWPIEGGGGEDLRAFLCAPLRIQDELIGVMTVRMTDVHKFDPAEIKLFETICMQVAIVIEKARLHHEKVDAERLAAVALGLSEIAHYIKNLLQNVEGGAFVVEKSLATGDLERVKAGWTLLQRSNRKIADLVANMLTYSRRERVDLVPGNVNDVLREVAESAQARAERNDVQIVESYEQGLPSVLMDEDALHDGFLNLVSNAIDALPDTGGVVVIGSRCLPEEGQVLVEVVDTGQGIPEEIQDQIFNLFFSTKGTKGTGIGLAATKKKIEAQGGTIDFESTPGRGTTFQIRLPANKGDGQA
jgi:signal transduction histidine kinase